MSRLENNQIILNPNDLKPYLTCEICKGYLRHPVTISECLHSFCKVCIYRHLYKFDGSYLNFDCPKCKIVLKPSPSDFLRLDVHLESIVEKILLQKPEPITIEEKEKEEKEIINLLSKEEILKDPNYMIIKFASRNKLKLKNMEYPFVRVSKSINIDKLKKLVYESLYFDDRKDFKYDDLNLFYNGEILGREHTLAYVYLTYGGNNSNYGILLEYDFNK